MVEVLPIHLLQEEDKEIFGGLNVALSKLARAGLPVAAGVVVSPPTLRLQTTLQHFDFGHREIFEQSLVLVRKELHRIPIPESLTSQLRGKSYLVKSTEIEGVEKLWRKLLDLWLDEVKHRLWKDGFIPNLSSNLQSHPVFFDKKIKSQGFAHFDPEREDSVIEVKSGKLHPHDLKTIDELIKTADKKLFIPHIYEWIVGKGVKLTGVKPFTPKIEGDLVAKPHQIVPKFNGELAKSYPKSTVRLFLDLTKGQVTDSEADGVFLRAEGLLNSEDWQRDYEDLLWKLTDSARSFSGKPVFFKLADLSEGFGAVRGSLRLLHQQNLFGALAEAVLFARNKKELLNIHIVIPFIREPRELLQIKRELAAKKILRKHSLEFWMEMAVPENIVNLEEYLAIGFDGIVLNLDEMISHLRGFDYQREELLFYKADTNCLIKFLDDALRTLHKVRMPFMACGNLSLAPEVLSFLVERGVYGIVAERYEIEGLLERLRLAEKRLVLKRASV